MIIVGDLFYCYLSVYPLDLHVLTPTFPTQRSSVLGFYVPQVSAGGDIDGGILALQLAGRRLHIIGAQGGRNIARGQAARRQLHRTDPHAHRQRRSEEHTSELQALMRISYAVFCLKKKKSIARTPSYSRYIND